MALTLLLPWPPTANNLYFNSPRGGRCLSPLGRLYAIRVGLEVRKHRNAFGTDRLSLSITANPPDRRRRDLSNLPKCLEDALTKARIWADDSQVDDLRVIRGEPTPGGSLTVTIARMTDADDTGHDGQDV